MRWSRLVTTWHPELNHKLRTSRRAGHPHKRWDDDIHNFLRNKLTHDATTHDWVHHATADNWLKLLKLEDDFVATTQTTTTNYKAEEVQGRGKCSKRNQKAVKDQHAARSRAADSLLYRIFPSK